jgi:hypothetical protein
MDLNKLYEIRIKLNRLSTLVQKKKTGNYYLTVEEKVNLLREGKRIPLRVKGNGRDKKVLVKTRGTINSGDLKNKRMGL